MKKNLLFIFCILLSLHTAKTAAQTSLDSTFRACSGLAMQMGVLPTDGLSYNWLPSAGLSSVNSSFTTFTPYCSAENCVSVFQLRITDSSGNLLSTINYTINTSYSVGVQYNQGAYSICAGDTINVEAPYYINSSIIPNPSSNYFFSDNESSVYFWPEDSTRYDFIKIDTAFCYFDTAFYQINVKPKIEVTLSSVDTIFCLNNTEIIQLDYSPLGGFFSGSGINQQGQFNIGDSGSGLHTITYTANPLNCPSSNSINLLVVSDFSLNLSSIPNFCKKDTLIPLNQGSPMGGDYFIDSLPVQYLNPSLYEPGIHYLSYRYQVANLCVYEKAVSFYIIRLPETPVIDIFPDSVACLGDSIKLTSTVFTSYLWNTGATTQAITVSTSGIYSVRVKGNIGCFSEADSARINFYAPFEFTIENQTYPNGFNMSSYNANDGTVLLDISGGLLPYEILWNGISSQETVYEQLSEGSYYFTIQDAAGCSANDSVVITSPLPSAPIDTVSLRMPNSFTPNSDGFNDFYVIEGVNDYSAENTFSVWDIKRQLVYRAINYSNGWDGLGNNGIKLPAGTYFAVLESSDSLKIYKTFIDIRY